MRTSAKIFKTTLPRVSFCGENAAKLKKSEKTQKNQKKARQSEKKD